MDNNITNLSNIEIPEVLGVLPIKSGVIFPNLVVPIVVTNPSLAKLIDDSLSTNKLIFTLTQKNSSIEKPEPEDFYSIGTVSIIIKMLRFPNNSLRILVQGIKKAKVEKFIEHVEYLKAKIEIIDDKFKLDDKIKALMSNVSVLFQRIVELARYLPDELSALVSTINDPVKLADFVASYVHFDLKEKQNLLETVNVKKKLERIHKLLVKELNILELGEEIQKKVKGELDKAQREFFLREQLKTIKKELGEDDERINEIKELERKINKAGMSDEALEEAKKELKRLKNMHPAAAETAVIRTYLDWLISLPWKSKAISKIDLRKAKSVLDEDHFDLEKVKERIIEHLAVKKLKKDSKGPILCFVGPPGVGKTSMGRSIARALNRKFIRISLGGIHDEAEIRGHRRTYVGALPGRIIQGIKKSGEKNPVFMLDEIDKVGTDFRGDPSSALLEVLDPEQNFAFSDHYIGVPFDLSDVFFIATANITDTIIPALKDRMEIIELPGYTEEEKLEIAKRYLIPREIENAGLNSKKLRFIDDAIRLIIRRYTREAGVRALQRQIRSIARKVATRFAKGNRRTVKVDEKKVEKFLGPRKFLSEVALREGEIGVATGLAWTPTGGEILFIESTGMKGQKNLQLTGSLGDVMKESAVAALSFLRAHAQELGINENFYDEMDIHIHVPHGAIPKDGPSAGIAIVVSLFSLLTKKAVKPNVAMTGEITLSGRILPVGGIKEKVLGARLAGIKEVLLPFENKVDVEEVPKNVKKGLKFHYFKEIMDVLHFLFKFKKENKR